MKEVITDKFKHFQPIEDSKIFFKNGGSIKLNDKAEYIIIKLKPQDGKFYDTGFITLRDGSETIVNETRKLYFTVLQFVLENYLDKLPIDALKFLIGKKNPVDALHRYLIEYIFIKYQNTDTPIKSIKNNEIDNIGMGDIMHWTYKYFETELNLDLSGHYDKRNEIRKLNGKKSI